jgi:putative tricarboxylic transport membrane protein
MATSTLFSSGGSGLLMRLADIIAALVWLAVAIGLVASGLDLRLGRLNDPGSGFMIFWIGVVMVTLCLAALVIALRQPASAAMRSLWDGLRWQHVPYVTALLLLYAWLLPWLGFPLVTALLLIVLFKTIEPQSWTATLVGALVTTAITYLVFDRWLGTQLPVGTLWSS